MNVKAVTEEIVKAILADVTYRRGWRQAWDGFDDDIRAIIKDEWRLLVQEKLTEELDK